MLAQCISVSDGWDDSTYKLGQILTVDRLIGSSFITTDGSLLPFDGGIWGWKLLSFKDYYNLCK